jgi:hypothetical protein
VTASLTGSTTSLTTSPGMAAGSCCSWFARHPAARQGRSASRQPRRPAIARCRSCGRHGLVEGPAGPGSTDPSPDERGGGLALAQWLPVAEPASRHRRALVGRCRPSSSPWPATAGPAPPPAARCRAPSTAGRRGCRTAGRGSGRPGSASRRSGGCTDGRRRAWASTCSGGPCRSPSRAGWRSPPVGGSSGRSRGVTALGLVARLRPAHQAGGHGQAGAASRFHRTLPAVGPAGHGQGPAASSATVPCPQIRSASGRPYAGALTRQVWPIDQAISPSPRASRDVAEGKPLGRQPRSRAGHQLRTAMVVQGSHRPAVRHGLGAAGRKSSLGRAGRSQ